MKSTETISYVSIAVIAISLFFIGTELTGFAFANDTAQVNVTIDQSGGISFEIAFLDFGTGTVTAGETAVIDSEGGNYGGYWIGGGTTDELILINTGNANVTLQLYTDKMPSEFIGPAATFEAKVLNSSGETGSCVGTNTFSGYAPINTTYQTACGDYFGWYDSADNITIEFNMTIPSSVVANRKTIQIEAVGTYA
jgi:hypothetical protein